MVDDDGVLDDNDGSSLHDWRSSRGKRERNFTLEGFNHFQHDGHTEKSVEIS